MPNLNLNATFYPRFTSNKLLYSTTDKESIERTVERLLAVETSAQRPGMLLGKIQSGKTKTFLAIMALAFDNGFDITVILTKGTKALARQTLERVRKEFGTFHEQDQLQVFDIMTMPTGLTRYELNQKLIFVAKKQTDNMARLSKLFQETYSELADKRVLIIDDEADYASIGFRRSREEGIIINKTAKQIDDLRHIVSSSAFLQVTATPYSLYLQPEDLIINGVEFKPVRPAFTELVPVHSNYVGSDYYFEEAQGESTVAASYLHHPITRDELNILHHEDRRRFRLEECLTHPAITTLRTAICNFIVGGCIRRLQDQQTGLTSKKFSFLVHTESQKAAHAWQERVVVMLNQKLTEGGNSQPEILTKLFTEAYSDISRSIEAMNQYLPPINEVMEEAFKALEQGWLMITKVNSERQVEELLDNEGQLRLRTPLNIYIGGQILDRGITIANLIGFFYGRRPQIYQQDTVLQHSRMFGFRPIEDLTVTRFYTEPTIYTAMQRMHEIDVALRETIEHNPEQVVVFIQQDTRGQIVPCSPNKILVSNTTTLRPFKRILPIGFQTDVKTRIQPIIKEIDGLLERATPPNNIGKPFEASLQFALDLLRMIEPTLVMDTNLGFEFDWGVSRAALEYLSMLCPIDPQNKGKVWCMVRKDRNLSRFKPALGSPFFSDAPDTAQSEGVLAKKVAVDTPLLMLIQQNGAEDKGWRGSPFYWPVIMVQKNVRISIFAHETTP